MSADNKKTPPQQLAWPEELAKLAASNDAWLPGDIADSLDIWLRRFDFYADQNDPAYAKFQSWQTHHEIKTEAVNIIKALASVEEMYKARKELKQYESMRDAAIDIIRMKLVRLHIVQCKLLENAQQVKRYYTWPKQTTKIQERPLSLKETKSRLSDWRVKNKLERNRFSKPAKTAGLPHTQQFFKKHESAINYKRHMTSIDKGSTLTTLVNAIRRVVVFALFLNAQIMNALIAINIFFQAIPIVNAIISSVFFILKAIDTWKKNKSPVKKALTALLVGIAIAGLITTGFGTLAVIITAVGLTALGIIINRVIPWVKDKWRIREKTAELAAIDEVLANTQPSSSLGFRERQYMLRKLEDAWLEKTADKKLLGKWRSLVNTSETVKALSQEQEIVTLLGGDIPKFLREQTVQRKNDLQADLSMLASQELMNRVRLMNSLLSLAGAICLCIPTPMTIIAGVSLLLISSVISVIIEFDLVGKSRRALYRLFGEIDKTDQTNPVIITKAPQKAPALNRDASTSRQPEGNIPSTPPAKPTLFNNPGVPAPETSRKEDDGESEKEQPHHKMTDHH